MSFDPTPRGRENPGRRMRRRSHRLIVIIVMAAAAGFIVKEQIPAVDAYIDRLLKPQAWQAIEACQQAVLAAVERPEFARILDHGEANATQKGYYVDSIVVGEMGASGTEVRAHFSCYVDGEGKVANTQRQP